MNNPKNAFFHRLKRIYWEFIPEMREWHRAIIFEIPGKVGQSIRRIYARKNFAACGKDLVLYPHIRIYNPQNLKVGSGVSIADYVQISAGGGVSIENGVLIGPYVKIWSINHNYNRVDIPISKQGWKTEPVTIEANVWIAADCIILPGTYIGKGSVISAGAVLRKMKIDPYSIIAGNPAKVVGHTR